MSGSIHIRGNGDEEKSFYGCTGLTAVDAGHRAAVGAAAFRGCAGDTTLKMLRIHHNPAGKNRQGVFIHLHGAEQQWLFLFRNEKKAIEK